MAASGQQQLLTARGQFLLTTYDCRRPSEAAHWWPTASAQGRPSKAQRYPLLRPRWSGTAPADRQPFKAHRSPSPVPSHPDRDRLGRAGAPAKPAWHQESEADDLRHRLRRPRDFGLQPL